MTDIYDLTSPCWKCSESGSICYGGVSWSGPTGRVCRTFRDEAGACRTCGHINTKTEARSLEKRRLAAQDLIWKRGVMVDAINGAARKFCAGLEAEIERQLGKRPAPLTRTEYRRLVLSIARPAGAA